MDGDPLPGEDMYWDVNYGEDPSSPWTHSDAVLNGVFQDILEINVVIISPLDVGG